MTRQDRRMLSALRTAYRLMRNALVNYDPDRGSEDVHAAVEVLLCRVVETLKDLEGPK